MAKRKSKSRMSAPDEVFTAGPLRMARYGRHVVAESHWDPKHHDEFMRRLSDQHDDVVRELDQAVRRAADLVARFDPLALLHRAWWERGASHLGITAEVEVEAKHAIASRMLDFVQSLIASTVPAANCQTPSDADYKQLQHEIEAIFNTLNTRYFVSATAKRRSAGSEESAAFEEFHFRAQLHWCNVSGEQYQNHQISALRELLAPQSDLISGLYGITSEQLCDELQKVWNSLTRGIGNAFEALDGFRQRALAAVEADLTAATVMPQSFSDALQESIVRHGLEQEHSSAMGLFFGMDLFELQKVTQLPLEFLEDFSWSPGQDTEFFSEGKFPGWPLRVWPTFKRPFLKVQGRYYCFDATSLFDHFFRQLEKRVFACGAQAKQQWLVNRKSISEALPFEYLRRLLPGCLCITEAYYWTNEGGTNKRFESDGIVVFDDHLIIVEVKAGAFTYTSPATDVDAHVQSLRALVAEPSSQGNRFLRYLRSADEVAVFDAQRNETARLRLAKFRHVTLCAVTLDRFTEIAAQVQRIPAIGVPLGSETVWSLSVDDLRVYADLFASPLEFLHYVEQRKFAGASDLLELDDELDHLGLYLQHNHYAAHAAQLASSTGSAVRFHGYRSDIDRFVSEALVTGEAGPAPRQRMPTAMAQLLQVLASGSKPDRSRLASYLLDLDGELRDRLFEVVKTQAASDPAQAIRPFSTHGDVRLSCVVRNGQAAEPDLSSLRRYVRSLMLLNHEADRVLLILRCGAGGEVEDVDWEFLARADIEPSDVPALQAEAEKLRQRRMERALTAGKRPGRNDACPCGSGRKYKKCCLGRAHGGELDP